MRELLPEDDSNLPAAYATIDTAHAKYHSHQVKVGVGGEGEEGGSGGGVVRESAPTTPTSHPSLGAKNLLYEGLERVKPRGIHTNLDRGGTVWSNHPEHTLNCLVGLLSPASLWFEAVWCGRTTPNSLETAM